MELPKAEHDAPEPQAAMQRLMLVAARLSANWLVRLPMQLRHSDLCGSSR